MELPTDVIVSILLRLPPSSRRLSRLVCRQWRDAVDTRTTEMQSRAKPLVITSTGSAHVLDDLSTTGSRRMLWKFWTNDDKGMSVVGTCNGLICLCENQKIVGAISLVNPVTGENMSVPETPGCANVRGHGASPHEMYGFAYHPTTGRYKIVHVPCFYGGREGRRKYHVVRVFTLGEWWWRDVATGNSARCEYRAGIVCVNGTMYWVAEGTNRVMAFDLDDERLTFIEPPPPLDAPSHSWHLTEVRGRLGIICSVSGDRLKLEVWVRDGSTKMREHKWIRRYIVQSARDMSYGIWHLTRPHFAHSEYLLTERLTGSICDVYKHKPGDDGVVAISERSGGTTIVLDMKSDCFYNYNHSQVFAYVETTEPLSVYKRSS